MEDAIAFIEAKGLHRFLGKDGQKEMRVISTGGGSTVTRSAWGKERLREDGEVGE